MTFIKDVMKDVLISLTTSSSNDLFALKSLTTECVLSSNKISYSLKSLIDTEAADYSFIDELIAQNVCNHLQIESLSLIKLKSIRRFDDHYAKKLITHAIYSNLTVQDHMKCFVFMLITQLDQHQMILKKTWMNKTEMTIDMRDDHLQFSSFEAHIKASIKAHLTVLSSKKIVIEEKSLIFTQILKRFISSVITQLSEKSSSFSKIMKSSNSINFASSFDSMNIAMIEMTAYRSLVKRLNVTTFAIIVTKIDRLLKTARNKLEDVNLQELSHEEILKEVKAKLSSKYHDYLDVFDRAMTDQLLSHHLYDHKIELIDEKTSSWSRLYHMSDYKLQKMKNYLIKHLNKDFISSSSASYASLILFVEKKDDSLRFCIDYRKLNALIKWNRYLLLLIDETLARIQDSRYLTQLNIIVIFNKLCMHSSSKDLTIFIISFDFYKYHVMSFELINGSTFYQHYMNDVLFDYLHQFCQIYLDDIIIYSKTLKKHKQHVQLVLHRLRETDLQMNINKCKFHVQKIFFLRLLLFIEELKMNLRKVQAVVEWFTSTNLTQMQFFVDFCNFYQRFIKNFSKIVHSLIQLTQKEMIFEWNSACQTIFDHMKKWMTEVLILYHFDQNRETILETDSFNYVNNDILSQYDNKETLHLMIYYSKNLSLAECNYKIYDKKLLAIIHVFKHWWSELKLTELFIKMFTDHQALTSLMKDKELSRCQMRWVQKLVDFNFKIMYCSDKQNIKVNALTRWVDSVSRSFKNERCHYQRTTILTLNRMKIADLEEKENDESIYQLILKANRINENCILLREVVLKDEAQYKDIKLRNCWVQNEILYQDDLLWVFFNEHLQMKLIQEVHDQSSIDHFEILRTMKIIRRYYYWSSMWKTIDWYIWNCYICQRSKTSQNKFNELLHSLLILEQQWKNIVMNFIIDLSSSKGKNVILTVICKLSKKRHYISCFTDDKKITAEKTAELMLQ